MADDESPVDGDEERRVAARAMAARAAAIGNKHGRPVNRPADPRTERPTRPDVFAVIPPPRARSTDPLTSHVAAASLVGVSDVQALILDVLRHVDGGLTDLELAEQWKPEWPQVSPSGLRTRRCELTDAGYIVDTTVRRPSPSGRMMTVWGIA